MVWWEMVCTCGVVGDGVHVSPITPHVHTISHHTTCAHHLPPEAVECKFTSLGDGVHVCHWEVVSYNCTCGVVGDGVHMWCGGRWCARAHVVWSEMVCTCGVEGDGVHLSKLILLPEPLSYNYKLLVDIRRLCIANKNLMINTIAKPENTLQ